MSGIREALRKWRAPRWPELDLEALQVTRALRDVELRFGASAAEPPPEDDLKRLRNRVARAFRAGSAEGLTLRDIRRAPWIFFLEEGEKKEAEKEKKANNDKSKETSALASREGFREWAVRELAERGGRRFVANLAYAWLLHYPEGLPEFARWRALVRRLLEGCETRRCRRLREAARDHGLLEKDAPERLWRWMLKRDEPIDACLEQAGLGGVLATGNLVQAAFRAACQSVREAASRGQPHEALLQRLFEFAEGEPAGGGAELRFEGDARIWLAESLLEPYARRVPEEVTRQRIKAFLLRHLGDPRLKWEQAGWHGVPDVARQVFEQWLVEETLEDFFRLLEHAARNDEKMRHHWKYRQAFWLAYLRRGAITEAWLAVGAGIDELLRRGRADGGRRYARLKRANRNHACLIFKIGKVVLTEWNHTGKWRMWQDRVGAPRLYQDEYRREELVGSIRGSKPFAEGTHHGSENGRWQMQLADMLKMHAGVVVPFHELMPR